MKTLKAIVHILSVAAALMTAACSPDDPENPLANTTWCREETVTYFGNDEISDQHQRHILRFEDDYTGVNFNIYEETSGMADTTGAYFTYTYENRQGVITAKDNGVVFDCNYTFDPDNATLHVASYEYHKITE